MRVLAAVAVLVSHSFTIVTGNPSSEPFKGLLSVSLGTIAVDMFFACSGFLVCASYVNRVRLMSFVRARMLRIFPALFCMLILTVLVVGVFISHQSIFSYFSSSQTALYLLKNFTLFFGVEYSLPGTFLANPYPNVVNGSLWTLPHEVRAYLALAVTLYMASLYFSENKIRHIFMAMSVLILFTDSCSQWLNINLPQHQFVHLFGVFLLGAALFLNSFHLCKRLNQIVVLTLCLTILAAYLGYFPYVYGFAIAVISIGIAYTRVSALLIYNRLGDYSYGIYIYAFPVQQILILYYPTITIIEHILAAFILTMALSIVSWHAVEKPFLALK